MTIEQVKAEAKKRFDKDLTDEQARAWLEAHPAGELQDEELENVSGGGCGSDERTPENSSLGFPPCPSCGHKRCTPYPCYSVVNTLLRTEYNCAKCGKYLGSISDESIFISGKGLFPRS